MAQLFFQKSALKILLLNLSLLVGLCGIDVSCQTLVIHQVLCLIPPGHPFDAAEKMR